MPVYTHQVVVRGAFHNFFCCDLATSANKSCKHSGTEQSTDLVSHACCSQVVTLYVHHFTLAENVFVVDVWSLMFDVSRITPRPELPRPTLVVSIERKFFKVCFSWLPDVRSRS